MTFAGLGQRPALRADQICLRNFARLLRCLLRQAGDGKWRADGVLMHWGATGDTQLLSGLIRDPDIGALRIRIVFVGVYYTIMPMECTHTIERFVQLG